MINIGRKSEVDKTPNRIAGMFDRIAPRYDFLNHLLSFGIDRRWRRRTVKAVLRRLPPLPNEKETPEIESPILDVATGTADLAIALARRSGRPVTGIDFSAEMLKIGDEKIRKALLDSQITLRQADALDLPFPDDSFSAVTVAFGLRNMADADRGISEMVRVCRSGGVVAVLEFAMPTVPVLSGLYKTYFLKILPKIGAFFSRREDSAYRYLPASVLRFDSIPAMKERFEKAGLTKIEAIPMTFGVAVLYLGRKT